MLHYFGYVMEAPTKLFQDNLSAIWLATHDGNFQRNKHTITERAFVKDLIENKLMTCIHQDTEKMWANMLTKPENKKMLWESLKAFGMEGM